VARCTLRYVEPLRAARTKLTEFFSILVETLLFTPPSVNQFCRALPALFITVRREIAQSPRKTGARSREAGQHSAWEPEGGAPPSWGFYKGAGPLIRVGEADSRAEPARKGGILGKQYGDRPSDEPACLDAVPTASGYVATALARSSTFCMIVARRENTA
jgi:hypothetical protein